MGMRDKIVTEIRQHRIVARMYLLLEVRDVWIVLWLGHCWQTVRTQQTRSIRSKVSGKVKYMEVVVKDANLTPQTSQATLW